MSDGTALASSVSSSRTITVSAENEQSVTLRLNAQPTEQPPVVQWAAGTIDNEHLNKKKSKCCCIYKKPHVFGESSSSSSDSSDDDGDGHKGCSDHCRGHKNKCYRKKKGDQGGEEMNQE